MSRGRNNAAKALVPPTSLDELSSLQWKDFELFALQVVEATYREPTLSFQHTAFSHDKGRDGHAEFVLGIHLDSDLTVVLRIWLEVKKRGKSNVGKKDVGSHLIDAANQGAHKLIFVTNRRFSAHLATWLAEFGQRTGIQHALIDGPRLLQLADRHLKPRTPSRDPQAKVTPIAEKSEVELRAWFTLDPNRPIPTCSTSPDIHPRLDRPVFLIIEACVNEDAMPFVGSLKVNLKKEHAADLYPYAPSRHQPTLYTPGDTFQQLYSLWPKGSSRFDLESFEVNLETDTSIDLKINWINACICRTPSLTNTGLGGQEHATKSLQKVVAAWRTEGGLALTALLAPAGVGKSHILADVRKYCAGGGIREHFIDCESARTDGDFLRAAIRGILPLPRAFLDIELREAIFSWCIQIGIAEEAAQEVADDICTSDSESVVSRISPAARADVLSAVLAQATASEPLLLVVEDLHKASPSVLSLLTSVIARHSAAGNLNVMLLLVSRPYSGIGAELANPWFSEMETLLSRESCTLARLQKPSLLEAHKLLKTSIPTLEEFHCSSIIEQVGTTPYALREAVLYLLARGILSLARSSYSSFSLVDPRGLRSLLASDKLKSATEKRLQIILREHADWLHLVLSAGACYGRRFPLRATLAVAGVQDSLEVDRALDTCAEWSIALVAPESIEWIEFDHDLVRLAVLTSTPLRTRRKVAAALLPMVEEFASDHVICALAYNAGLSEKCYLTAKRGVDNAKQEGRVADAVEFNQLAIQVLDPSLADFVLSAQELGEGLMVLDQALVEAPPCPKLDLPKDQTLREVLDLLSENLRFLSSVGSGSSQLSESTLTEARLIAERLGDTRRIAELCSLEGRMWFERNDSHRALRLHKEADAMFERLGEEARAPRAANLVRLGICLRKNGQLEESIAILREALRYRLPGDWTLLNKVRNNIGAAYLQRDWEQVRYHWSKQIAQARRRNLPGRQVHGLASLSFIDLFEGHLEEAARKITEALEIAEQLRLDNQKVRLWLNLSVYYLLTGRPSEAQFHLLQAEDCALRHGIGRRLWRVVANLATTYEVLGQEEKAWSRDVQTVRLLGEQDRTTMAGKEVLPFSNILLRTARNPRWKQFEGEDWASSKGNPWKFAALATEGRNKEIPRLLGHYCVTLPVGPRFLLTE